MRKFIFCTLLMLNYVYSSAQSLVLSIPEETAGTYEPTTSQVIQLLKGNGYQIQLKPLPGMRAIHELENGLVDGDINRIEGFDNIVSGSIVKVDTPISFLNIFLLTKDRNINEDNFRDYSFVTLRGFATSHYMINKFDLQNVEYVKSIESIILFIDRREGFGIVLDTTSEKLKAGFGVDLLISDEPIASIPFHIWLSSENEGIAEDINRILLQAIESKNFTQITY